VGVDLHFELLRRATPTVDLHDPGDGQESAAHDPVLHGAQVRHAEVLRTHDLIAIDLARGAVLLDGGRDIAGQVGVLLQGDGGLRIGKVKVHAVLKYHAHERQPVERGGADDIDPGGRVERNLHRPGVVTLHFLG